MAWQRMIDRLTGKRSRRSGRDGVSSRKVRRRMLLERLDRREVLAADIGAIAGTAFVDEALDGLSESDPRLESVNVELYEDDGVGSEGVFSDSGGDADTLIGTTTTAGGGDPQPGFYRFDDLSPGDYWVVQTASGGLTAPDPILVTVTNDGGAQVQLIDDYSGVGQNLAVFRRRLAMKWTELGSRRERDRWAPRHPSRKLTNGPIASRHVDPTRTLARELVLNPSLARKGTC